MILAQQAVTEYRELAAQNPDTFQPNLAMALVGLANRLGVRGCYYDALVAAQEAVGIYSKLSELFRPELALALNCLAKRLGALGHLEEALSAARNAVDIWCELEGAAP